MAKRIITTHNWSYGVWGALVGCLLVLAAHQRAAHAQATPQPATPPAVVVGKCTDELLTGYVVRSVKVKARYLPASALNLPPPKTPYSPKVESDAIEEVRRVLTLEENREGVGGATEFAILKTVTVGKATEAGPSSGAVVQAGYIDTCVKPVKSSDCVAQLGSAYSQCVDIEVRPISVRIDTSNPWANLLNLARSNAPTFFSNVPGPLQAFNPKLGVDTDRSFGVSPTFSISTNLLDLQQTLTRDPVKPRRTRLDLSADGRKSADERYYETNARLSLSRRLTAPFDTITLEASFEGDHRPLGDNDFFENSGTVGGSLKFSPSVGVFSSVTLGGLYRWSSNRFSGTGLARDFTSENAFGARLIADGHMGTGVTRVALWADVAAPAGNRRKYQRLAGMAAYAKEFPVAPNQTIGLEASIGAGRAWGNVPGYARFYGGNTAKSFLYEPDDSPTLADFPHGPLLRSFGSGQAAAGANPGNAPGGTSYWHVNTNVAFPIPAWSRPLVPDIIIPDFPVVAEDGTVTVEDRPIRELLKRQGGSAIDNLRRAYVKEGLSREEAQKKAEKDLSGINSMLRFLADEANLYSLKPVFMFDAGRVWTGADLNNRTRLGIGGGLQLTVVTAKFEAGYVRAVRNVPGDSKGNFVLRLVFQNFF